MSAAPARPAVKDLLETVKTGVGYLPDAVLVGDEAGMVSNIALASMSASKFLNLGAAAESKLPPVSALCHLPFAQLAIGFRNGGVTIVSQTGLLVKDLVVQGATSVASLALLRNGYLAAGHDDGIIRVWDVTQGTCLTTLTAHARPVSALIEVEGMLMSGSADSTVAVWQWDNASSKVSPRTIPLPRHRPLPTYLPRASTLL